mgnify:CR=1 FL=1
MKILLINPPRSPFNGILDYAPEEARPFIHKKLVGPPLGLLTIEAAVRDFDVSLFDMKGEYDLIPESPSLPRLTKELVEKHDPDIVGVTAITSEFDYALQICQTAKQAKPDILTVAGGLHTTLCPYDFAGKPVDVICPGHAGNTFRELVLAKYQNMTLEKVRGIYINTPSGLHPTHPSSKNWNAARDNYLMPDRTLLERWRNTYWAPSAPSPVTYTFTSLGCPYRCTFCSIWSEFGGKYYQRDIESLIEELKQIDYQIVRFADANTIINAQYVSRLFDRIQEEGIQKEYVMDIRADTAVQYPWLIEKLAKNGLKVVICGFESYKDSELDTYNKHTSASYIEQAIHIFHENNISVRGNYVVPPHYEEDDFKALADYAASHKVNFAGYTILTPLPGTPFYKSVKNKIIDHDYKKYNFFNGVLETKLPLEDFYRNIGALWLIKKGMDTI